VLSTAGWWVQKYAKGQVTDYHGPVRLRQVAAQIHMHTAGLHLALSAAVTE